MLPATAAALIGTNASGDGLEEKPGLLSDGTGLSIGGDPVVTKTAAQTLANKTLEGATIVDLVLTGPGGALALPSGPGEMVVQEAGSWTPRIEGTTVAGAHGYAVQNGTYIRTGKFVVAWFSVALTAVDHARSGSVLIAGLPFPVPSDATGAPSAINAVTNVALGAGYTMFGLRVRAGGNSDANIVKNGDNVPATNVQIADLNGDFRRSVGSASIWRTS